MFDTIPDIVVENQQRMFAAYKTTCLLKQVKSGSPSQFPHSARLHSLASFLERFFHSNRLPASGKLDFPEIIQF